MQPVGEAGGREEEGKKAAKRGRGRGQAGQKAGTEQKGAEEEGARNMFPS